MDVPRDLGDLVSGWVTLTMIGWAEREELGRTYTEKPYKAGSSVWYILDPRLQFLGLAGSVGPSQSVIASSLF